jgi:hypothetical protein
MNDLLIVTGAPAVGKTTTVDAITSIDSSYAVFDIDWLADTAGDLAGSSIYTDSNTWRPYAALWFEVLHSVIRNSLTPIFFTSNSPRDLGSFERPEWCKEIHWLLLDCNDKTRQERLNLRTDWTEERRSEALCDAKDLRGTISNVFDTSSVSPSDVAAKVLAWAGSVTDGSYQSVKLGQTIMSLVLHAQNNPRSGLPFNTTLDLDPIALDKRNNLFCDRLEHLKAGVE